MVTTHVFGESISPFRFWTFIFVHFEILKKLSHEKTRYFRFFKCLNHYIL